jgi:hypothetical protein
MTATPSIASELTLRHSRTRDSVRHWCARAATGSSVIRVFERGTKEDLLRTLLRVPIEAMPHIAGPRQFEEWFEGQLERLARVISSRNKANPRVNPGLKWGHAAKVLALYLRDVVLHSRFFTDAEVERVAPWLFVPVDSKVMERLSNLGVELPFTQIREIATKADFYVVQNLLADSCAPGIARVVFDDVWADRDPVT